MALHSPSTSTYKDHLKLAVYTWLQQVDKTQILQVKPNVYVVPSKHGNMNTTTWVQQFYAMARSSYDELTNWLNSARLVNCSRLLPPLFCTCQTGLKEYTCIHALSLLISKSLTLNDDDCYVRVFLSIVSFYFVPAYSKVTLLCYLTSEFLDALGGHSARALCQRNPVPRLYYTSRVRALMGLKLPNFHSDMEPANNNSNTTSEVNLEDSSLYDLNKTHHHHLSTPSSVQTSDRLFTSNNPPIYGRSWMTVPDWSRNEVPINNTFLFYRLYILDSLTRCVQQDESDISNKTISTSLDTHYSSPESYRTLVQVSAAKHYSKQQNLPPVILKPRINRSKSRGSTRRRFCLCVASIILALVISISTMIIVIVWTTILRTKRGCDCAKGYDSVLTNSLCTCVDRDECILDRPCSSVNSHCVNSLGSYVCQCRLGFIFDNDGTCIDVNECLTHSPCNPRTSICINLPGQYYCQCLPEIVFSQRNGTNIDCIHRDLCEENPLICGQHSKCLSNIDIGGYKCHCATGFERNTNGICTKIDECLTKPCDSDRHCILTADRYDCCRSNITQTGSCSQCGMSNSHIRTARVVGGEEGYRGQFPWVSVLGMYYRDDLNRWVNVTQKCAATLIDNFHLLTAAHCLSSALPTFEYMRLPNRYQKTLKDTYRVSFGVHDIQRDINLTTTYALESACIYPNYNHNTLLHDIAVLTLKEPIVRNSYTDTICMPDLTTNGTDYPKAGTNVKAYVAGFGSNSEYGASSNVLMYADLLILPRNLCPSMESERYQICAGWKNGRKDACRGDSGGPLMLNVNNTWYLAGIVSYGEGCSRENSAGIYTRVVVYLEWIKQVVSATNKAHLNCSRAYDYSTIGVLTK
ncbi:unnamed protein product [Didymodactylos carnosus]|uniref:Uncharacterized protein n=1 Tax=Didymodactylos carnosus TaxID=1234261 RepID=A0A813PKK5_9BILA|nr:unnamed protein product [Didymodactylos carnosus]CAF3532408.1 unnamed protein product [Didymodactylos carnosus]